MGFCLLVWFCLIVFVDVCLFVWWVFMLFVCFHVCERETKENAYNKISLS